MENILMLASIRRFLDENMPDGIYVNVDDDVKLPSSEGDYSGYDAVIIVDSTDAKEKVKSLFAETNAKVAVVLM